MNRALLLLTLLLIAAPLAGAQDSRSVYVTSDVNEVTGTLLLSDSSGTGEDVTLPQNTAVTWTSNPALAAGADVDGSTFTFDLYFSAAGGQVTVKYGYWLDGAFTSLNEVVADVKPTNSLSTTGRATGSITLEGEIFAGAHPAIQLQSATQRTLHTREGLLGMHPESTATIPLPELSTIVLMGMGLATVGGVVYLRRRA